MSIDIRYRLHQHVRAMTLDWSAFPSQDLAAAKTFAAAHYDSIGSVVCPVLNHETISFNRKGMAHILYKSTRTKMEIIDRLFYLQYAEQILLDPSVEIDRRFVREKEYVKKRGNHILCDVESQYWCLKKEVRPSLVIKLIVRQVDRGNKHFYSIMRHYDL